MLENSLIQFEDFEKVQIHVGQIIEAKLNLKAIKLAYILTIDFGELGIKTSSAQLTQNYSIEDLIDKKIIAVVNFPVKKIAGVKSEVLVLATICNKLGTLLISADSKAINGSRIK